MDLIIPYSPLKPTGSDFHKSDAKYKLIVGGKGSGKTTMLLHEGLMLSCEYPGNVGVFFRETLGEVQEVIIDPLLEILPQELIAEFHKAPPKRLKLTNGSIIHFRPLDEARKVKGLNLGWVGIDEVDAIDEESWLQVIGQLRRPGVRLSAIATTNPTDIFHWIYDYWVRKKLKGYEYFRADSSDNAFLPPGFISSLYEIMPESWVRRYIGGHWGSIAVGDRVYQDFVERIHVDPVVHYDDSRPVIRCIDFGYVRNACLFSQLRPPLGVDFLGELFRQKMDVRSFSRCILDYSNNHFPGAVFEDYGDIAGRHSDPTSGTSPLRMMEEELSTIIVSSQIPLKDSLDLVRTKLTQLFEGASAIRLSPSMRLCIEAMNGGYVLKKSGGRIISDVPAADSTFEDLMDCFRYTIWHKFSLGLGRSNIVHMDLPEPEIAFEETSW